MAENQLARAFGYPYPVPEIPDYLFSDGTAQALPDKFSPGERLPVLAIGSNRSPEQLLRKYGTEHSIPITEITLNDVDVGFCAYLTPYGSVPATLMHASGTTTTLKITWLTREQLLLMHQTESVGPHTLFGTLPIGELTVAGQTYQHAYTYVSARGLYPVNGSARALVDIPAQRRQFTAMGQREMLQTVWQDHGDQTLEPWLIKMINTPSLRESLNVAMTGRALHALPTGFESIDPESV